MRISTNSFSKSIIGVGNNSFARIDLDTASNIFSRAIFAKSGNAWTGPNLTSTAYGEGPYGSEGEYGGYDHFKNRTQPDIDH